MFMFINKSRLALLALLPSLTRCATLIEESRLALLAEP
jgi:hypothetical protein